MYLAVARRRRYLAGRHAICRHLRVRIRLRTINISAWKLPSVCACVVPACQAWDVSDMPMSSGLLPGLSTSTVVNCDARICMTDGAGWSDWGVRYISRSWCKLSLCCKLLLVQHVRLAAYCVRQVWGPWRAAHCGQARDRGPSRLTAI